MRGKLDELISSCPFQPDPFCDFVIIIKTFSHLFSALKILFSPHNKSILTTACQKKLYKNFCNWPFPERDFKIMSIKVAANRHELALLQATAAEAVQIRKPYSHRSTELTLPSCAVLPVPERHLGYRQIISHCPSWCSHH